MATGRDRSGGDAAGSRDPSPDPKSQGSRSCSHSRSPRTLQDTVTLRSLLREGFARTFQHDHPVADAPIDLGDLYERTNKIAAQRAALAAINRALQVMGKAPLDNLAAAIDEAATTGDLLAEHQANILRAVNREGDEAKHGLLGALPDSRRSAG